MTDPQQPLDVTISRMKIAEQTCRQLGRPYLESLWHDARFIIEDFVRKEKLRNTTYQD